MTDEPLPPGVASGRKCIAAIRALLETIPATGDLAGDGGDATNVWSFVEEADQMTVYQLVALNAATIRWASVELGRTEAEVLDQLATNF